ncbi:MAG: ABC transporter permease, partial [Dehalococcoidia bacterium]
MTATAQAPEIITGLGALPRRGGGPARRILRFARRNPLGAFGAFLVLCFLLMAILAPSLAPYKPTAHVARPLLPPSSAHLLGTNASGNDVLSRVIAGSQISLTLSITVVLIHIVLGTSLGLVAGYFQGPADYLIQRTGEIYSAFPGLIALLLIVSLLGTPRTTGGNLFTIAWELRNLIFAFSI